MTSAKDLFIYSSTILAIQCIRPVKYGAEKKEQSQARGVRQNECFACYLHMNGDIFTWIEINRDGRF